MKSFTARLAPAQRGRITDVLDRLVSFVDQGFQGVANVLVSALLARALTKTEFASIGLMLGIYYFVLGLHRAHVVLPFILDGQEESEAGAVQDRWWTFNVIFVAASAVVLALIALAAFWLTSARPNLAWICYGLAFAAAVTPALLMAEFARRWLYQARRPHVAALASAVYFILNVGIAAVVYVRHAGPIFGVGSWIVAAGCFTLVAFSVQPARPASIASALKVWAGHRQFTLWQMMTHFPYALYNNSVVILISSFGGAAATVAFTVARSLNSPVQSVVSAVDLLDKPRAVRALMNDGIAGLRRSVQRTRRLLVLINGAYGLALVIYAPWVLKILFGPGYLQYAQEVRLLAVAFFLTCLNQPSETLLIVLRESKVMFAIRLSVAVAVVAAMAVASPLYGAAGCIGALCAAQVLNLIELWVAERWAAGRWIPQEIGMDAAAATSI